MSVDELKETLGQGQPPEGLAPLVRALWWDAKGNWEQAHEIAQEAGGADGAWVHAYLHRREGDAANARYWYRQARQPGSHAPLAEEWDEIASALLAR